MIFVVLLAGLFLFVAERKTLRGTSFPLGLSHIDDPYSGNLSTTGHVPGVIVSAPVLRLDDFSGRTDAHVRLSYDLMTH